MVVSLYQRADTSADIRVVQVETVKGIHVMRYSALVTVLAAAMAATATTAVAEVTNREMGAPISRSDDAAFDHQAVRVEGMGAVQSDLRDPKMEPLGIRESAASLNGADDESGD